jgi:L-alanine-DL-glutamate epimerase-like enolase superfamily enzyme
MVDAHTWWRMGDRNYSLETVEQLAESMADSGIAWLEEPMPPDDHAAYLALKEKDIWRAGSTNPAKNAIST